MMRLRSFALLSMFGVVLSGGLTGCSLGTFPDASANPTQSGLGTMSGNVYGGHAPLVGAHVYVLSPGTSGYGSQASSLLSSSYSNNLNSTGAAFSTTLNTGDPNIPTSWYYETTDSTGGFNISGDYTCTAGNPVYLYAYGGTPQYPQANNTFSISSVNVLTRGGSSGAWTYTATFTVDQSSSNPTENFYAGEPITISGMTGNYAVFNGIGYVTSNSVLSTTTFELSTSIANAEAGTAVPETYTSTSTTELAAGSQTITPDASAVAAPGFNPAVVNLAVLGVCPSTGTLASGGTIFNGTTSSPITYIYMNEVSTVAAAYALEGFTPTAPTATTNATNIGSSAANLIGIENATLNAAQLYDIGGKYISTTYAGEGHIANPTTPAGNGSVPQNLLDTLGNILASCVDSRNTSATDGNSNESTECTTLFETATSNGIPKSVTGYGTIPIDIAQAAINIAQNPAGASANTATFMTNLYSLPTGNVPFAPYLTTKPNDFTVAIQFPRTFTANSAITSATTLTSNSFIAGPESIAIDSYGNTWINNLTAQAGTFYIYELNPQGVLEYESTASTYARGYLTIDPANNVWSGANASVNPEIEIVAPAISTSNPVNTATTRTIYTYSGNYGGTTAPFNAANGLDSYMTVASGNGNIYLAAAPPGSTQDSTSSWYTLGLQGSINQTTPGTFTSLFTPVTEGAGNGSNTAHGAVENASTNGSGDIWWTNENTATNAYAIVRVSTTGVVAANFPITYSANNNVDEPEMPAIDSTGNLWAATQAGNALLKVTQGGTVTKYTNNTFSGPFGVSIDGANNVFIANRNNDTGTSIAEASNAGAAISPAAASYTLGGQLKAPLNVALDPSGNLWITCYASNEVVEWIGAGVPISTPLSLASKNNKLATAP